MECGSAFVDYADHRLSLPHDISGEVTQPNFSSSLVARFIFLHSLPDFAKNRRFFVSPDLSQSHCVPRGYPAIWGIGESGKDRLRYLICFPEVGK